MVIHDGEKQLWSLSGDLTVHRAQTKTMTDGRDGSDGDSDGERPSAPETGERDADESTTPSADDDDENSVTSSTDRNAFTTPVMGESSKTAVSEDRTPVTEPSGLSELSPEQIEEYTTERRKLSPRVQVQWAVRALFGAFVLGLIVSAVVVRLGVDPLLGGVPVVAFLLTLAMVWVVLYYRRWVYQVRTDALYLERGVVTHVRTLVPYVRIQHVDTSRGPFERALGLSTLVVYTAGSRGADVSIPGLRPEEARDLQQRVKELAIEAEGGDAL